MDTLALTNAGVRFVFTRRSTAAEPKNIVVAIVARWVIVSVLADRRRSQ